MKTKKPSEKENIDQLLLKLPEDLQRIVNELRRLVLAIDLNIDERVKWNSPSFFYQGPLKSSNPKEYPNDLLVVNLSRHYALLIFPSGASIAFHDDVLEGSYTDGRRMLTIKDYDTLEKKSSRIQSAIIEWIRVNRA